MIPLKTSKLLEYLQMKGFEAALQTETNQIIIVFKIGSKEYPLFIRIFEGDELLQLLAFIPCTMKPEMVADTSRLLHLLNKELDIPGFGMDETTPVIFYRCMLPIKNEEVDETVLDAYLSSIQIICKSFTPVIASVAFGAATFEEVLKKSREKNASLSSGEAQ